MIELSSGAKVEITLAEFEVSKALYQAVLEETQSVEMSGGVELDFNFGKDVLCLLLSSKKVERCLWECMKRATYNGLKIDKDTFEPEAARGDYLEVCYEVAKANILPFVKNLFARFSPYLEMIKGSLGLKSPTTP